MHRVNHICVIILLTIFVAGTFAATAMAYCDSGSAHNGHSTTNAVDGGTDGTMAAMDHDGVTKVADGHSASDGESGPSNCFDCDGSLCHGQTLAPIHSTSDIYDSTVPLFVEKEIIPTTFFIARIPQPPKQLS